MREATPELCAERLARDRPRAPSVRYEASPYLHDGRLLTLDDTVEFFNLILSTHLTDAEKKDLLAFLYVL